MSSSNDPRANTDEYFHGFRIPTWEDQIAAIRSRDDLTDDEETALVAGLLEIKDALPPRWLREAHVNRIPIVMALRNRAPWAQEYVAAFGRYLARAKSLPGFDAMRRAAIRRDEFDAFARQVCLASRFVLAGFDIVFEPPVGERHADLLVTNRNGQPCYIELKRLFQSDQDRLAYDTYSAVFSTLVQADFDAECNGAVHAALSEPALAALRARTTTALEEIRDRSETVRLAEPGAYDLTLSRRSSAGTGSTYANIDLPPKGLHTLDRLRQRIHKAQAQLPGHAPSVLAFDAQIVPRLDAPEPALLVPLFEETLAKYPHLTALVLTSSWCGGGSSRYEDHGDVQIYEREDFGLWTEAGIVVKNRYCKFDFPEDLIRAIAETPD